MTKPIIFVKISYKILHIRMPFKELKYSFLLLLIGLTLFHVQGVFD